MSVKDFERGVNAGIILGKNLAIVDRVAERLGESSPAAANIRQAMKDMKEILMQIEKDNQNPLQNDGS